ncbi:CLUMA_CG001336, isoform A [Clunio marinus]|uniref:CLUMA_CG001336, isoform A n=1 Tax=Clunio marinus TaxID=568069 RepID=A0A1J1HHM4_9DIPT|nr:CLUMA_CG001336, isoform A [Clunio marinus]
MKFHGSIGRDIDEWEEIGIEKYVITKVIKEIRFFVQKRKFNCGRQLQFNEPETNKKLPTGIKRKKNKFNRINCNLIRDNFTFYLISCLLIFITHQCSTKLKSLKASMKATEV